MQTPAALIALSMLARGALADSGSCPSSTTNRALLLRTRPSREAPLTDDDFEVAELPKPEIGDKQLLVRNLYASLDPTQRIWTSDDPQYMPPAALGQPMRAATIGVVEQSNDPAVPVGAHVLGGGGIQQYYVTSQAEGASVVPEDKELPLTAHLSVLSFIIGLTAYVGTYNICDVKAGETFVVSAAGGAVGSLAGQLAKLRGARVIGIVGSPEKARWLTEELGFDAAVSYKQDEASLINALRAAAPNGVDAYFENTGGVSTEAVLHTLNNNARIAMCGVISGYNSGGAVLKNYPMLLHRRVMLKGFICMDYAEQVRRACAPSRQSHPAHSPRSCDRPSRPSRGPGPSRRLSMGESSRSYRNSSRLAASYTRWMYRRASRTTSRRSTVSSTAATPASSCSRSNSVRTRTTQYMYDHVSNSNNGQRIVRL
jgi:NADPH-dependent curcumin reductase CurA